MPIYEYICNSCSEEFEELVLGSKDDVVCKKCASGDVRKKMSGFAVKGSEKTVASSGGSACSGCVSKNCGSCK
ncbi:MAG: zinc ribbon domain-containing protein [Deltaproteobacteria bacterium]|uniref:Zinc ribbon domain-containing protein n=1 Tax=Candidatus Zymogenus saltonus TaxID=2844893 RepID=A0A9D8PNX1_9DELT|nr:zinc ribbon domain-containing protein [Candidatus Zymogenus saltonus]